MRHSRTLLLAVCILTLSLGAGKIYAASPSDAGHVYFVEPVAPYEPGNPSNNDNTQDFTQPETPADNRTTVKPNTDALRQVVITEQTSQQIASQFPNAQGKAVYSLMGNENISVNTDARAVNNEFATHLEETGEEIMLPFPSMTASEPGIYVLGVSMAGIAEGGTLIDSVSTITPASSAANFRSAADIEQITLLDQGGNPVDTKRATNGRTYAVVPDNQNSSQPQRRRNMGRLPHQAGTAPDDSCRDSND